MSKTLKDPYSKTAITYAKSVISGKTSACWQVKAACQRHIDDFKRKDLEYREDFAAHVCQFAEHLPHIVGPLAGEKIKLEPFQVFLLANLFGWTIRATGLRRYREAFVLLPRGNAKSTLAAIIALYMTFAQGQGGAQGFCGATSMAQAEEVFRPAKAMVEGTPDLAAALGIETAARSIYQPSTNSSFKMVIARTKDGGIPWIAIADELHEAISDTQLSAFRTGLGKRRGSDPLLLIISTAGTNLAGVCRQEQLEFEAVLKGVNTGDSKFALIYTIDPEDDWTKFEVWQKANPNYGVSVDEAHLHSEYLKALQTPSYQATCRTKYLNQWVNSATSWLNDVDWTKAANPDFKIPDGARCWIGADLSTKTDITALTLVAQLGDDKFGIVPYLFLPEGALERSKNAKAYVEWIEAGAIQKTDGAASDHEAVEEKLRELCETHNVQSILFDSWQSAGMMQKLARENAPVEAFGQHAKNFNAPMIDFEADLMRGNIVHPDNPCLNWMAANISLQMRGILMSPSKPSGQDHLKIDGMVAALMAYSKAVEEPAPKAEPFFFFV